MAVTLNWTDPAHWSPHREPCVWCGALTNLRTANGRPAHKTCVERVIAQHRRKHLRLVDQPTTPRTDERTA